MGAKKVPPGKLSPGPSCPLSVRAPRDTPSLWFRKTVDFQRFKSFLSVEGTGVEPRGVGDTLEVIEHVRGMGEN